MPSNTYATRDGKYIVIGANNDSIFKRFMHAIGRDDLANDPQLANNSGRVTRTEEIDRVIEVWTRSVDLDEALEVLISAEVPAGKIYDIADIAADPQYAARNMLQTFTLGAGTTVKLPGIVPKLEQTPGGTQWVGPTLGAHTREILTALGYTAADVESLSSAQRHWFVSSLLTAALI